MSKFDPPQQQLLYNHIDKKDDISCKIEVYKSCENVLQE